MEAPGDHRAYVGGAWAELGELELAFMKQRGLKPAHTLLDLGCGALRGGVHFVRYLDAANYFGIDLNPHLLDAGYERELSPLGLAAKLPRSNLAAVSDFDATRFRVRFDFVLCVSVWTHLPLSAIEESMRRVASVLKPAGRFFSTFYACPEDAPLGRRITQYSHGPEVIVTHADRVLSDPADRLHLARIYFEHVAPRRASSLTYYNLLRHLAEHKADERAWRALSRIRKSIREAFGSRFEIINDFYSYRSARSRIFPNWHQDIEFWMTGDSCDGFNLWVLLDHERMNYSFDVYDVQRNAALYDALYGHRFGRGGANYSTDRPLFSPDEYARRSPGKGGFVIGRLPGGGGRGSIAGDSSATGGSASSYMASSAAASEAARGYGVVPLEVGDALVVRQVEIHRTDLHPVDAKQWRLALGFKVVRRDLPVSRPTTASSPFGYDLEACNRHHPGLVPPFVVGKPVTGAYNRTMISTLRLRDERFSPVSLLYALAENPIVLIPMVGVALLLAGRRQGEPAS